MVSDSNMTSMHMAKTRKVNGDSHMSSLCIVDQYFLMVQLIRTKKDSSMNTLISSIHQFS